ncbi:hypothetical protein EYZ11_006223 [Aspergillus tanneri]|uniref:RNase H type-1 domain-containing protein n=1 Tax=Aspergillus tanneri TaxID=1220188 RepID=A0A4S3JI97_9EURO|nr:hypothetical protein EYZ11_006223 [Aspergillus tanneri]
MTLQTFRSISCNGGSEAISHPIFLSTKKAPIRKRVSYGEDLKGRKAGSRQASTERGQKGLILPLAPAFDKSTRQGCWKRLLILLNGWPGGRWINYVIFSDSQAALKSIRRPRLVSGQEILRECLELLQWCNEQYIQVTLRWIPAHQGVPGNEAADQLAKQAAQRGPLRGQQLVMLQSAAKRKIRAESKAKWAKAWQRSRTGRPTKRLIKAPEKGVLRRINMRESARCGCDLNNQTPKHVLMACPILTDLRMDLRRELQRKGCGGVWMEGYESVIQEVKASVAVADFMIKTGLLGQFPAVDSAATGVTNQAQGETSVSARAR